jgi:hypothetical protein
MTTHDDSFGAIVAFKKTLPETVIISRDPDRLSGVIGLEHVITLHLHGDDQVGKWIRIRLSGLTKLDVARHVDEGLDWANVDQEVTAMREQMYEFLNQSTEVIFILKMNLF